TDRLPPNLKMLFAARPALKHLRPLDRDPEQRRGPALTGIGAYVDQFSSEPSPPVPESQTDKRKRLAGAQREAHTARLEAQRAAWAPEKDPNISGDAYHTLIVGRLNYELTEKDIRREFETYGRVIRVRLVKDTQTGQSRGYAFVEFEREGDMRAAYRDADGMSILGRRIVVDVERGRTVKGWRPRRLGGGLG
ncbi:hypothetical protein BJ085DRAFT_11970, partial [Dimargaris cristalligena]